MWQVVNSTPFVTERSWVRDRNGGEVWLVAVRGTFDVATDGRLSIAETQSPVQQVPLFEDGTPDSSLRYDSDFGMTKQRTDVILHGCAYAPHGRPVTEVAVGMRVGGIRKMLSVIGDRSYLPTATGFVADRPRPFVTMPVRYERAHGGRALRGGDAEFDDRNPIGTGFDPAASLLAPNVSTDVDSVFPAGFGPVPSHWRARARYAGTYDDAWIKTRLPLHPQDLDDRYFQCAPDDQQSEGFLRGGESVELVNLTPEGRLAFELPRISLGFETDFDDGEIVTHRADLHTVILEPELRRVILVWRSDLPCHAKVHALVRTTVWNKLIRERRPQVRV